MHLRKAYIILKLTILNNSTVWVNNVAELKSGDLKRLCGTVRHKGKLIASDLNGYIMN